MSPLKNRLCIGSSLDHIGKGPLVYFRLIELQPQRQRHLPAYL